MNAKEIEQVVSDMGSDDLGTFGGSFEGGAHIQQIPDEIAPALAAISESGHEIRSYLEIGAAAGGMAALIARVLEPSMITLIDDNKHHKAGLRPSVLVDVPHVEIVGQSWDEGVVSEACLYEPYDLVFIDGDHTYPGVKVDAVTYAPMVAAGGFLMFHDSGMSEWGVMRLVKELKGGPGFEFVGEYLSSIHPRPLGVALFRKVAV